MLNGSVEGHLNVQLFYETLGRILGEKYSTETCRVKLTPTVRLKEDAPEPKDTEEDRPIAV